MKALIQRVKQAKVTVGGEVTGTIGKGILVLLGVAREDSEKDADYLADKITQLRIFPSETSSFDHSLEEVKGDLLVVSQFTLHGSTKKGRRPDFTASAQPELAERLYDYFIKTTRKKGFTVATGRFGAMMDVELINDGPVTLMLDSESG
ncbi:D-tyrosyl-tRNA(Tyr) deacylase [Candidatus Peregrinibacteria bacterium]|nr:D-tyrosyl-tRNA(Tyr) deacylase [Candidatus Peregrinibacteria bacterium]